MLNNQIKVKISTKFPDWSFLRQTPESSGIWENCTFHVDDETSDCDWWVVLGGINKIENANCFPNNTILITDEPTSIKEYDKQFLKQFNTIVTVQRNIITSNIINKQLLPWYVGAQYNFGKNIFDNFGKSYDELKNQSISQKNKLISVISSIKNKTPGHKSRLKFIKKLKKHFGDKLDVFGFGINQVSDKWNAIAPYKYHIVIENSVEENYWTEKLADSYLSESYPIYYGCPNINEYFEINALTKINILEPEEAIKIIEKVINDDYFDNSKKEICNSKEKILDYYQIFPQLCMIINNLELKRKDTTKIQMQIRPEIIKKNYILNRYIGQLGLLIKKISPNFYYELKNIYEKK